MVCITMRSSGIREAKAAVRLADVMAPLAAAIEIRLGVPAHTIQRTALVAVRPAGEANRALTP